MDLLTYFLSQAYSDSHGAGAVDDLQEEMTVAQSDIVKTGLDSQIAVGLLINDYRQQLMQKNICEEGTVTLTNTGTFPYNNSKTTVSLQKAQSDEKYVVIAECASDPVPGTIGEIIVSEKLVNGFKIAYTGSAQSAQIHYTVIGGIV